MRLLLDTHTFLWFIEGSPQCSVNARALIEDVSNLSEHGCGHFYFKARLDGMAPSPKDQQEYVKIRIDAEPI